MVAIMVPACVLAGGCGGTSRRAPTGRDIRTISAAMSDIVYQCQSVAAGFTASADTAALRADVDELLGMYHRVRADAPFALSGSSALTVHTTLRKQLAVAAGNLENGDCYPAQARRIAATVGTQ